MEDERRILTQLALVASSTEFIENPQIVADAERRTHESCVTCCLVHSTFHISIAVVISNKHGSQLLQHCICLPCSIISSPRARQKLKSSPCLEVEEV